MENLTAGMFIMPVIALLLVLVLYFHFRKKVFYNVGYRYFVLSIAFFAFLLHLVWEMAHAPLYVDFEYDHAHFLIAVLASLADSLMVLILLFGFGLLYNTIFWIRRMNEWRILFLVLAGTTGAILGEIVHVGRGDWAYTEAMPVIPLAEVGLSPILQFAVLPWLIFFTCGKLIDYRDI